MLSMLPMGDMFSPASQMSPQDQLRAMLMSRMGGMQGMAAPQPGQMPGQMPMPGMGAPGMGGPGMQSPGPPIPPGMALPHPMNAGGGQPPIPPGMGPQPPQMPQLNPQQMQQLQGLMSLFRQNPMPQPQAGQPMPLMPTG